MPTEPTTAVVAAARAISAPRRPRPPLRERAGLLRTIAVVLALALWELLVRTEVLNNQVIAPPTKVAAAVVELAQRPDIRSAMYQLLTLIVISFAIACAIGVLIGSALGLSRIAHRIFHPFVLIWFSTPNLVFLPILVTLFGFGTEVKIIYGALSGIPPVIVTMAAGVRMIDQRLLNAARSLGASRTQRLLRVTLPASTPALFTALSYALKHSLLGVLIIELFSSQRGIGYFITLFTSTLRPEDVYALLFAVAALAIVLSVGLSRLEKRMARWHSIKSEA